MNSADVSVTINIRAPRQQRDLIDRAAAASGKTRTEFMLEASRRAAMDALLDQRVFVLAPADFDRLTEILDAPAGRNPRLEALMQAKAPWEG